MLRLKRNTPLPVKTFDTIEFGAHEGHRIHKLARKNPKRLFAVVDPVYQSWLGIKQMPHFSPALISTSKLEEFVNFMKKQGLRSKSLVFRMPSPWPVKLKYVNLEILFAKAKSILLPNGKIIITTESPVVLNTVESLSKKYGLKVRYPIRNIKMPIKDKSMKGKQKNLIVPRSIYEGDFSRKQPVFYIEITYGLKKAVPNKLERAHYPNKTVKKES